jgi:DUF438 domain-containing protein
MFMIEGEWTGYTSAQQRVVHREYVTKKQADAIRKAIPFAITYTDGTKLIIYIKEVSRRKLPEMHSYDELIKNCVSQGVCTVAELKG